jgi:predicted RNase H-like HicB family nuclease
MKTKTKFAYPAQFIYEDNGTVSVFFPDLKGCHTCDDTLENAVFMAKDALEGFIELLLENNEPLPKPSDINNVDGNRVMLVVADIENIKSQTRYVKKTLSIPYWLNAAAEKEHINFSGVLQEALIKKLEIS